MTIDEDHFYDRQSFGGNVVPLRLQPSQPAAPNQDRPKPRIPRVRHQPKANSGAHLRKVVRKQSQVIKADASRNGRKLNRAGLSDAEIKQIGANTIGQRMAQTRLKLNLTQEAVAARVMITSKSGEASGVKRPLSRNAYCMYERDFLEPSFANMTSIAEALGVEPAWLAFGGAENADM